MYITRYKRFIKYLKRGYGRTTHLASIDIRNDRLERRKNLLTYMMEKPKSLGLFLKMHSLNENEFYDIVSKHVIEPHKIIPKKISKDLRQILYQKICKIGLRN